MAKTRTSNASVRKTNAAPPLVEQINNGRWLDPKEARSLLDELYYQRAQIGLESKGRRLPWRPR